MDKEQDHGIVGALTEMSKTFWPAVIAMGIAADEAAKQVNESIKALADLDISRKQVVGAGQPKEK